MKRIILLVTLLSTSLSGFSQVCSDFAVQLSATVQASPARITLKWKKLGDTTTYVVYRKAKNALSWGSARATLGTRDSEYVDNAVLVDSAYEYFVAGSRRTGSAVWPSAGYIYAAIKAPAIHNRGGLILLVDSTFTDSCAAPIHKLMKDLSGDGWQVIRHDLSRTLADTGVRRIIKNDYNNIPGIKAVLLLGHIAVPYSGNQNPDGHTEHKGAWPTDHYYAYLSNTWTDASVNNATSSYPANKNIPGDGKWDAIGYTDRSELQVGRIDFYDMPAFSATEVQLMRNYLARDHAYKMDSIAIRRRALVDDNFGVFAIPVGTTTYYESFASSGWRNFAPIVGKDSIAAVDFISSLDSGSFLWAYGCGGGSFTSAGGIGNTSDFATKQVNGIFTMLFGSYFGDWNVQNNFLRAPMCAPTPALTSCWSGRPFWFFHQMALGEHIGYCSWHSQNNDGALYGPFSIGYNYVTAQFLGDLSLRHDYIKPASNLNVTAIATRGANLSWSASPDAAVIGYYVYRCDTGGEFGVYNRVSNLITSTTFRDSIGTTGLKYYMVKPVKEQSTPSGSYYNLGLGISDSATIIFPTAIETPNITAVSLQVYPNPASKQLNVMLNSEANNKVNLSLMNLKGETIITSVKQLQQGQNQYKLDISMLSPGMYFVNVSGLNNSSTVAFIKE